MNGEPRRGTGSASRRGAERAPKGVSASQVGVGASAISISKLGRGGRGVKSRARLSVARTAPTVKPRLRPVSGAAGGPKTSSRSPRRGFSSSERKRRFRDLRSVTAPSLNSSGDSSDRPLNSVRPSDRVLAIL
jgi:hypothetical protein